jgi:uncharacterized membrane protein YczE
VTSPWRRLAPSRSVPVTSWRAPTRWRASPATLVILAFGLTIFGAGEGFLVNSGLGVSPWTVLAEGIDSRTGIGIGWATFAISLVVLLLWIPLRERPGLGTLANAVLIALALGVTAAVLPTSSSLAWRSTEVVAGIALIGLGSGFYLTAGMGPGPRDGWMTGLHHRTGWPVTPIRLAIEVSVLVAGWLLGGTVGVGTVAFALFIGPSVGYGLRLAGHLGARDGPPRTVPTEDAPGTEA